MNAKRMEMLKCFGNGMSLPLWKGVMMLIDEKRRCAMELACVPDLPDKETHMLLGGVRTLMELKVEMEKAEGEAAAGR